MANLMKYKGVRVLVIDGGSRQSLPIIRHFHEKGCIVTAYCSSRLDVGYNYRYADRKILRTIDYENEDLTWKGIYDEVKTGQYDLVIPMIDCFATILSKHKDELSKYATIYVNDWNIYSKAIDKLQTMSLCMDNNIPCPRTAIVKNADEIKEDEWTYPLVIKPRTGMGAKGFNVAHNRKELLEHFVLTEKKFGPSLIQEYIPQTGAQYQVELLIDKNGDCKAFVLMDKVRWYPLIGGSSTMNVTLHDDKIKDICLKLMKAINWRGYASLDVIRDPRTGEAKIMEINPRMNGTAKICFECGVNLAEIILQDAFDDDVSDMQDYQDGIGLRYFHMDVLWFLKSKERFKCKPSWFSMKNTTDEIFEWRDLRPGIVFTLTSVKRLLSDGKKRKID